MVNDKYDSAAKSGHKLPQVQPVKHSDVVQKPVGAKPAAKQAAKATKLPRLSGDQIMADEQRRVKALAKSLMAKVKAGKMTPAQAGLAFDNGVMAIRKQDSARLKHTKGDPIFTAGMNDIASMANPHTYTGMVMHPEATIKGTFNFYKGLVEDPWGTFKRHPVFTILAIKGIAKGVMHPGDTLTVKAAKAARKAARKDAHGNPIPASGVKPAIRNKPGKPKPVHPQDPHPAITAHPHPPHPQDRTPITVIARPHHPHPQDHPTIKPGHSHPALGSKFWKSERGEISGGISEPDPYDRLGNPRVPPATHDAHGEPLRPEDIHVRQGSVRPRNLNAREVKTPESRPLQPKDVAPIRIEPGELFGESQIKISPQHLDWADQILQNIGQATREHSYEVGEIAAQIAEALGHPQWVQDMLRISGPFHDWGKSDPGIWYWVEGHGRLKNLYRDDVSSLERDQIRGIIGRHPEVGHDMAIQRGIQDPNVLDNILSHHNRVDTHDMSDWLKIFALADHFQAIIQGRSYTPAADRLSPEKIMQAGLENSRVADPRRGTGGLDQHIDRNAYGALDRLVNSGELQRVDTSKLDQYLGGLKQIVTPAPARRTPLRPE